MAQAATQSGSLTDTFNDIQNAGSQLWHGFHKYVMLPSMVLFGAGMAYTANKLDTSMWDIAVGFFQHSIAGFDIMTGGLGTIGLAAANMLEDFDIFADFAGDLAAGSQDLINGSALANIPNGFHMMPDGSLMANTPSDFAVAASGSSVNAISSAAQVFSTPMDWFNSLPMAEQISMRADADAFGIPFDEYVKDWCANNHVNLSSPQFQ